MSQKSHPTTAIVEWLLFCAPYRRNYFRRRSQSAKSAVINEQIRLKTAERMILSNVATSFT